MFGPIAIAFCRRRHDQQERSLRCRKGAANSYDYQLVLSSTCPGVYTSMGLAGYVSSINRPGSIPVYSVAGSTKFSPTISDVTATPSAAVIVGYVLP